MVREEMPWAASISACVLMNEHSEGFPLKKQVSSRWERNQALTVRAEVHLFTLQLGWHHGIKLSSLVIYNKGWEFFYLSWLTKI
jgi:hypothetical protein